MALVGTPLPRRRLVAQIALAQPFLAVVLGACRRLVPRVAFQRPASLVWHVLTCRGNTREQVHNGSMVPRRFARQSGPAPIHLGAQHCCAPRTQGKRSPCAARRAPRARRHGPYFVDAHRDAGNSILPRFTILPRVTIQFKKSGKWLDWELDLTCPLYRCRDFATFARSWTVQLPRS